MNFISKKSLRIKTLLLSLAFLFVLLPIIVLAGNPFSPLGVVYINSNGTKSIGSSTSENSKATAISYRNSISSQSMITDQPGPHTIFPAGSDYPAYTMWDVGSSAWTTPQAAGQDVYLVLETYTGMNNWTSDSYVGGAHKILTSADISDAAVTPPDIIMEKIPTPSINNNTETSIEIQFSALLDRTDVASQGSWNDSIVGYTVYRSSNGTSSPVKIGTVSQPNGGGGVVTYSDTNVVQGVNYFYKLSVNYRWGANTPNPWYETLAQGSWSESIHTGEAADAVKFISSAITASSTMKAGPITIAAYNFISGDVGKPEESFSLNLSSNSTGQYKFYEYIGGSCSSNQVSSVTLSSDQNTVSFCYSDTLVGSWTITADPSNDWESISQSGQVITVGSLDHFDLNFSSPQINNSVFTGVNTISARDAGNNLIGNFNSQGNSLNLSVSNGAVLANSTISSNDFVDGVANLTSKNFKYTGQSTNVIFEATSTNGKKGTTTIFISPGSIQSIKLRNAVGGAGSQLGNETMTVDNTLSAYAAGYDISDNYISDISGTWGTTGSLENNFSGNHSSVIFAPSQAPTIGSITFSNGLYTASTGIINVGHGALNSFVISEIPTNQIAGESFNINSIRAVDSKGNTVLSYSATVSISDTTGTVSPTRSSVFVDGQLSSQSVSITKAQSDIVITISDSGKSSVTNNFIVKNNSLDHFELNFNSPQINNQTWTGVNQIKAQDEWDNLIVDYSSIGDNVNVTSSKGVIENFVLTPSDFVDGVLNLTAKNFKYTGTKGSVVFTATSQNTNKSGTATVVINSGSINSVLIRNGANNSGIEQDRYDMQVGENLILFAAAYDISNNFIADISGSWSRTGTLDAPISGSNSINYQPMTAYTSGAITFDDGNGHTDSTGQINVNRGPLNHFQLNLTSPQVNGNNFSGTNLLTAKDVGNNTITDYNVVGSTVTLTATGEGTSLSNNIISKNNFVNGSADLTLQNFSYIGKTGSTVITALSESGKTGTSSVEIGLGNLHHFDFSLNQTQLINTPFTGENTLTAKDIGGNVITNFNALVDNVTITTSPYASTTPYGLAGPAGNMIVGGSDFQNGIFNLSGKLAHSLGGSYIFTATSVSGKTGVSNIVEIDVGPLHHFSFQTIGTQHAGQIFSINLTAYAQDPQGNNHIKTTYNGSVELTDASGIFSPVVVGPFVNGQITTQLTLTKAMSGNVLHIKDKVDANIIGDSNAFNVQGGSLHHFYVSQSLSNQSAGVDFDLGRIEARDQWDNLVTDFNDKISISDNTNTISPVLSNNFLDGVLTSQVVSTTQSMVGNRVIVTNQSRQGASNIFNVNPSSLVTLKITEQVGSAASSIEDRLISTDDALSLYSLGFDLFGNYIGEIPVKWNVTGNLDAITSSIVSYVRYSPDHAPLLGTITIDDQSGHQDSTGEITVKHGNLFSFSITTSLEQTVGVALTSGSSLTALDSKGNLVKDFNASVDNVSITASTNGVIKGLGVSGNNIINTSASFVDGVADLNSLGLIYAGQYGSLTLQALSSSGKGGVSQSINFGVGPLDHFDFSLKGVQSNNVSFVGINTIKAVDAGDNLISSFNASSNPVTISTDLNDGSISGLSGGNVLNNQSDFIDGVANLSGKLKFVGTKGPHTFIANSQNNKTGSSGIVEILAGPLSYLQIRNASGGGGGIIGNQELYAGDAFQLYAAAYDESNNFIQDQTVSWVGTGVAAHSLLPVNGSNTVFNTNLPGEGVIFANVGSIFTKTGTISVSTGQVAKLVFLSSPYDGAYNQNTISKSNNQPVVSGRSSGEIVIQAQDVVGNVVTMSNNLAINLSTTGSGSFSESSDSWEVVNEINILNGQSQASVYYKDNMSGTYTLTFDSNNTDSASQQIVFIPYYDNNLVFVNNPRTVVAGQISQVLTIELRDSNGQLATSSESIRIELASNSAGVKYFYFDSNGAAEITQINMPAGNSRVDFYYKDSMAGKALLNVKASGFTEAYQLINVLADEPTHLFITPGPTQNDGQEIIQNYASEKITVQVLDKYENLVNVSSDTTIHLSSDNETGDFTGDGMNGVWKNTSDSPAIIISSGNSEGYFYYRDSTVGSVEITASAKPEHSWSDASQGEVVYAPVISKLAFITSEYQIDTNVPSPVVTIQAQDALGNAIVVSENQEISLISSDPSNGKFSLSPDGPWDAVKAIIPAGSAQVSFYYKDSIPGIKNLGVSESPSLDWDDAVQKIVINAGAADKIAFISASQSITKNYSSGSIIIQLQDSKSQPTTYPTDLTLNLYTDSAGGSFTTNSANGPWGIGSVTLPAGSSNVVIYYKDQNSGTFTLGARVSEHTAWQGSQLISITEGVISKIGFITNAQSIRANIESSVITVQTQNERGDPIKVGVDTVILLESSSNAGQFAVSTSSTWGINQIVIPAGSSQASFYYKDSSSGTFILRAYENSSKEWSDAYQQVVVGGVENTISKIAFKTAPKVDDLALSGGEVSGKIQVETRSFFDDVVAVSQVSYLVVNSNSPTAKFSLSASGPFSDSVILTLDPGDSVGEFYCFDNVQGSAVISVAEFPSLGWTDAQQSIEIKSGKITQLAFLTPSRSMLKNNLSDVITIEARDIYGNTQESLEDVTIDLSSNSGTGAFFESVSSINPITSIVLSANHSSVSFYYRDNMEGSYVLTVDENPDTDWTQAQQSIVVTESSLDRLVIEPSYSLLPTETTVQMSAIGYNSDGEAIPDLQINWYVDNQAAGQISQDGILTTKNSVGVYNQVVRATAGDKVAYASLEIYKSITQEATSTSSSVTPVSYVGGGVVTVIQKEIIKSEPPTNASLVIDDGAEQTDKSKVKLSLYATGASYYKVSKYPSFEDAKEWKNYVGTVNFNLTDEYGNKVVYAKFLSASSDESSVASDNILYQKSIDKNLDNAKKDNNNNTDIRNIQNEGNKINGINSSVKDVIDSSMRNYNYTVLNQSTKVDLPPSVPTVLSPIPSSYILQDEFVITGKAPANTIVTLYIHSPKEVIVKVVTDSDGSFVYRLDESLLEPGEHQVYASIEQSGGDLIGPPIKFNLLPSNKLEKSQSLLNISENKVILGVNLWIWLLGLWFILLTFTMFGLYKLVKRIKNSNFIKLNYFKNLPLVIKIIGFLGVLIFILLVLAVVLMINNL